MQPSQEQQPSSTCWGNMVMPSTSSSLFGDYIGMESCVDLKSNPEDRDIINHDHSQVGGGGGVKRSSNRQWGMKKEMKMKEFPPPIPLLARTGNLPSRMPWVLKRRYTSDGRLILTEEKVRHHEYFRAHRSNGRLTLQLVPLDSDVLSSSHREGYIPDEVDDVHDDIAADDEYVNVEADNEEDDKISERDNVHDDDDDDHGGDVNVYGNENGSSRMICCGGGVRVGGGGKCLSISHVAVSAPTSCLFGGQVQTIRPVIHS